MIVDLLHVFQWIVLMEFDSRMEAMQELKLANLQAYVGVLNGVEKIQRSLFHPEGNVLFFRVFGMLLL